MAGRISRHAERIEGYGGGHRTAGTPRYTPAYKEVQTFFRADGNHANDFSEDICPHGLGQGRQTGLGCFSRQPVLYGDSKIAFRQAHRFPGRIGHGKAVVLVAVAKTQPCYQKSCRRVQVQNRTLLTPATCRAIRAWRPPRFQSRADRFSTIFRIDPRIAQQCGPRGQKMGYPTWLAWQLPRYYLACANLAGERAGRAAVGQSNHRPQG